jgi:hypothetical protein
VLNLDPPINDIAFPYARLAAFFLPWKDGYPPPVRLPPPFQFSGYPNITYFWDTVCYVGWLPWGACIFLLVRAIVRRRVPESPWSFIAVIGIGALVFALPWWHAILAHLPGTILRSPARQIYITGFALSAALAAGMDAALAWARSRSSAAWGAVALAIVLHAWDLGRHDRAFVSSSLDHPRESPSDVAMLRARVDDQRVAIDYRLNYSFRGQFDDVGVFDSILLAKPYRALLEMAGAPARFNTQAVGGTTLPLRALQLFGVRCLIAPAPRPDLLPFAQRDAITWYDVPDPLPRASWMPRSSAIFLTEDEIHQRLKEPDFDLAAHLLLPSHAKAPKGGELADLGARAKVGYRHESSDRFVADIVAPAAGYLRLLETWDRGWRATLDGEPTPLICAYDSLMAVAVPAGTHQVRLVFLTPGAWTGRVLSLLSFGGLILLLKSANSPRSNA